MNSVFPFTSVVGMDEAKQALLLLAVDPRLKGVIIGGVRGAGKTTLARAFPTVLPEKDQNRESRIWELEPGNTDLFIEIPLGVTDDCLLGGIDLERTLAMGTRRFATGLLAQAHGGTLFADDVNLHDRLSIQQITSAINTGFVSVEREGFSQTVPTEFMFIGTYDPDEGELPASLIDSVAFNIILSRDTTQDERFEIIERVDAFTLAKYQAQSDGGWQKAEGGMKEKNCNPRSAIRHQIARARRLLPRVQMSDEETARLSLSAMRLGIGSHRADIFGHWAARASAAIRGSLRVQEQDLITAIRLVLAPRSRSSFQASRNEPQKELHSSPDPQYATRNMQHADITHAPGSPSFEDLRDINPETIDELIIKALNCPLPDGVAKAVRESSSRHHLPKAQGARGNSQASVSQVRGRFVRAVSKPLGHRRIAIEATLRSAAPWQARCRRLPQRVKSKEQRTAGEELSAMPQALCPLPSAPSPQRAIKVRASDLRFKQLKHKPGLLIIFMVDASGSMASNRMNQAKGVVVRLLERAYTHRDKVALIGFRGNRAEVLLSPSRSVERAKRVLESFPAGGGTPLAAGLVRAMEVARNAQVQSATRPILVLLTDGRANVSLQSPTNTGQGIWQEIEHLGRQLQSQSIPSVVIDTQSRFTSGGETRRVAELLGGRYVHLARADVSSIHDAVVAVAERNKGCKT